MKKNVDSIGKEKMTDQELSQAFGRYQRRESIGILLGALLVIAGCISAFVQHNLLLVCILAFAEVGLILLLALPAQKKKNALIWQQLGGYFGAELKRFFGEEPEKMWPRTLLRMTRGGLTERDGKRLRLTPRGMDVMNGVLVELLRERENRR